MSSRIGKVTTDKENQSRVINQSVHLHTGNQIKPKSVQSIGNQKSNVSIHDEDEDGENDDLDDFGNITSMSISTFSPSTTSLAPSVSASASASALSSPSLTANEFDDRRASSAASSSRLRQSLFPIYFGNLGDEIRNQYEKAKQQETTTQKQKNQQQRSKQPSKVSSPSATFASALNSDSDSDSELNHTNSSRVSWIDPTDVDKRFGINGLNEPHSTRASLGVRASSSNLAQSYRHTMDPRALEFLKRQKNTTSTVAPAPSAASSSRLSISNRDLNIHHYDSAVTRPVRPMTIASGAEIKTSRNVVGEKSKPSEKPTAKVSTAAIVEAAAAAGASIPTELFDPASLSSSCSSSSCTSAASGDCVSRATFVHVCGMLSHAHSTLSSREEDLRLAGTIGETLCSENEKLEATNQSLNKELEMMKEKMKEMEVKLGEKERGIEKLKAINSQFIQGGAALQTTEFESKLDVNCRDPVSLQNAMKDFFRQELVNEKESAAASDNAIESTTESSDGSSNVLTAQSQSSSTSSSVSSSNSNVDELDSLSELFRLFVNRISRERRLHHHHQRLYSNEIHELQSELSDSNQLMLKMESELSQVDDLKSRIIQLETEKRMEGDEYEAKEMEWKAELKMRVSQVKLQMEYSAQEMGMELEREKEERVKEREERNKMEEWNLQLVAELDQIKLQIQNEQQQQQQQQQQKQQQEKQEEEAETIKKATEDDENTKNDTPAPSDCASTSASSALPASDPPAASPASSTTTVAICSDSAAWSLPDPTFELSTTDGGKLSRVFDSLNTQWNLACNLVTSNRTGTNGIWASDRDVKACQLCQTAFTFWNRRHHW